MRPRRAQESPGVAQNSPGANNKPEEVPKSLRVRMRARSITTQPVHTATNSKQERNQKACVCACVRAIRARTAHFAKHRRCRKDHTRECARADFDAAFETAK